MAAKILFNSSASFHKARAGSAFSGTAAAIALKHGVQPRALAANPRHVAEVQRTLATSVGGPGVLLWPYHDLPPEHPSFVAANLASLSGVWQPDADDVFFRPDAAVSAEAAAAYEKA